MQLPLKSIFITAVFCIGLLTDIAAQKIYTDSLNNLLRQHSLPQTERVNILCKLARANFETNLPLSFKLANEALEIGAGMKDGRGKAMAFATLVHLYIWKKDLKRAYESRDSARYYAKKTKDRATLGFVWYRDGWLDLINDENDKAITKFLKSIDLLKGQKAYEYESTAYHYLASFYGYGNDPTKQQKYAALCMQTALKSQQVDLLNNAYFTVGQTYFDRFKLDTNKRALLDSALLIYKKALRLSEQQSGRLLIRSNTAAIALNTANSYFQYFPNAYRDSAEKYTDIAIGIATKTNLQEVLVNCYGLKSEYALRDGNYDEAEKMLLTGLNAVAGGVVKMPLTQARMFLGLSHIAEKRGDQKAALNYLKQNIAFNKEAFNEDKINSILKVEAQYQSEKKEQEIAYLQQEAAFTKKRNIFYIVLALTGIIALLFLLRSYNYKLKASVRKQELVDKEKNAAELRAQLKEAEAVQLQTEQVLLRERQERLQKEVLAGNLQVEEKNELLELLSGKVNPDSHLTLDEQIKRIITQQKRRDKDFEEHKTEFFETNPAFFERLQQKASHTLTRLDLKYCSYILMGLSNKEISTRLGIEPKSIRMARYRIKQKFNLGKEENLDHFILIQGKGT
ncbi:DNA-binding CsgD family transcriptional regulator [Pedobacter africanus]|uniref:DNA-binding CsgD family transcriptional regulator n=1 Tax=Pedobacter africanus TaxID=151894 RepID=A0ACC6KZ06_9SPHI|nr:LuxR C-terminal-related transcriptional regulator [Pedobacter africanus]MDR6784349.1 DNA-binding CsgD family transcriptional regulator [Pedobacter africanus]